MSDVNRRDFLKGSLAAGATFAIGTFARPVLGANEVVNIGVAGVGGRGGGAHVPTWLRMKDVRVTWLVDPDSKRANGRVGACEKSKGNGKPTACADVRKALDDKSLNAISIASTNSTHSIMAIWACQADKDVYVEKPGSHHVHEGRILVETAKKHNRIVQHGSQRRGDSNWAKAAACARTGACGKLLVSYGVASKPRGGIGHKKTGTPPAHLNWDVWLGPAPQQPYHGNLHPYNWHWFWDFGNADTGNQGVHQMDVARWGIPGQAMPTKVMSLGGRFAWNDQGQTPNSHLTIFEYDDADYQLIFESCNLVTRGNKKKNIPNTAVVDNFFFTTDGTITHGGFTPKNGKRRGFPKVDIDMGAGGNIFDNFIRCVRSRKSEDLLTGALHAHLSSALCHLGAICYRLGEIVPFSKSRKAFGDNKAAYEALMKMEARMMSRGVKIDDSLKYRVGPVLTFNPKTEKFIGDHADRANKLIRRKCRAPYLVPEKVI